MPSNRWTKVVTQPELNWTKRKLLQQLELGGRYASIVGARSHRR
jgi:hypothetical protein